MSRGGRPLSPLTVTDEERSTLEAWARRPKTAQALATRVRIVLAAAEGLGNDQAAARIGIGTVPGRSRRAARRRGAGAHRPGGVPRDAMIDDGGPEFASPPPPTVMRMSAGQGRRTGGGR